MANWKLNQQVKGRQIRTLMIATGLVLLVITMCTVLLVGSHSKKTTPSADAIDLTGIVNESFTEANADSALTAQQSELESLKAQIGQLAKSINEMNAENARLLQTQSSDFQKQITQLVQSNQEKPRADDSSGDIPPELKTVQNPQLWRGNTYAMNTASQHSSIAMSDARPVIHTVSFRPKRRPRPVNYLDPSHYVPSNTSVKAVILGGADADASVNGQSKNNGVMIFKFIEDGRLPNGQLSRLHGCRVSANSYGDISSERAFATLYKLSCAYPGQPIIDKEVTGWVFYKGKAGIKGRPVMKDGKVMKWAGVSGALSGIASAAQYAQSVQQFGAFGASSVVPSGSIAPYAAYGGASKAADTLSQYYVKRAEQYHPVIPIGAGNEVTVVFKDGFYLEPEDDKQQHALNKANTINQALIDTNQSEDSSEEINFSVPPEVLGQIDRTNSQNRNFPGEAR